jgi:hypothetical protein
VSLVVEVEDDADHYAERSPRLRLG